MSPSPISASPSPVRRHTTAVLKEVSFLSPGSRRLLGRQVIRITERGRRSTECVSANGRRPAEASGEPVGEVLHGGPIIRRNVGQVLGVR